MRFCLLLAPLALSLASCGATPSDVDASKTLHETMTDIITPASDRIQALAFELYDEEGELAPQRLSGAQWDELMDAGDAIEQAALHLGRSENLIVARDGVTLENEGSEDGATIAEIAAWLEADPKGFSAEASKLAGAGQAVSWAAESRDAMDLDRSAAALTETCTSCHQKFWYPEQAE